MLFVNTAGYYYVWYYVQGDDLHENTDPLCMMVYIEKLEAAVSAIDQIVELGGIPDTSIFSADLTGAAPGHGLAQ